MGYLGANTIFTFSADSEESVEEGADEDIWAITISGMKRKLIKNLSQTWVELVNNKILEKMAFGPTLGKSMNIRVKGMEGAAMIFDFF